MEEEAPARAWAMPGTPAEQDDGAGPGGPGPVVGSPVVAGDAVPGDTTGAADHPAVPHVALRPMTVADVLDGAFAVIKARPRRILLISAGFVAPVQVAAAYLAQDSRAEGVDVVFSQDPTLLGEQQDATGGDVAVTMALLILPSLALVCVAAALAHLVTGWTVGHDAPAREMLGVVARRWWPLLATFVVVHLAEAAGIFACYVGVVFVMALFLVVAPVIGAEGASTGEALRRSVRLTRTRYWPSLGLAVLMGLVSLILGQALAALPQGIAALVGVESGWPLLAVGGLVGGVLITPFVAGATVLLYLDLRVRTEGLDLEITARDVLDRAA
ncbi:MAG TPA: hypothetical protein VF743_09850 [Acidimicrobiales bacterium]